MREAGQPRAGAKQLELGAIAFPGQQAPQRHQPPLFIQQLRRTFPKPVKNKKRQPLERQDVQARVAGNGRIGQQLPFELIRRLLWREQ